MASPMGLYYVTIHADPAFPPSHVQSHIKSLVVSDPASTSSPFASSLPPRGYLYRATDLSTTPSSDKPAWLAIWDLLASSPLTSLTLSTPAADSGLTIHSTWHYQQSGNWSAASFHTLEGQENYIVAVQIRLATEWATEYDRYYAEEHAGALSAVPGWRRTRRFVAMGEEGGEGESDVQTLQLHDYDPKNYGVGGEEFHKATTTEWYKKMMAEAVLEKVRRTYELVGEL